jgi:DNA-binding transcriptional regulator YhcF (GntR family)
VSSSADKALAYLRKGIAENAWQAGESIGSVKVLARNAHVSSAAMVEALKALKEEGVIEGVPGHSYRIAKPADIVTVEGRSKWERIAAQMKKDLISGAYGPQQELPSVKQLCHMYGCAHPTIRKVLSELARQRLIEQNKRAHYAVTLQTPKAGSSVVFLAPRSRAGLKMTSFGSHIGRMLEYLENACAERNVNLRVGLFEQDSLLIDYVDTHALKPGSLVDEPNVLGYIILISVIDEYSRLLFDFLARANKRAAFIDQVGDWKPADFKAFPRASRIFPLGVAPSSGTCAGRYLLELGHKKIVYVTAFHHRFWSVQRVQNIKRIFCEAGYGDGVTVCICEQPLSDYYVQQDKAFKRMLASFTGNLGEEFVNSQYADRLNEIALSACRDMRLYEHIDPALDKALKEAKPTAIVAANDYIGMHVLGYCRRRGIDVPQDMSIFSFDDIPEAALYRLTTYNFNIGAIIRNALAYVLGLSREKGITYEEIRGMIIKRGTTGAI